jgi:hypothetical protein
VDLLGGREEGQTVWERWVVVGGGLSPAREALWLGGLLAGPG